MALYFVASRTFLGIVYTLLESGIRQPDDYAGSNKYSKEVIKKLRAAGLNNLYFEKSGAVDSVDPDFSDYIRVYKDKPLRFTREGLLDYANEDPAINPFLAWRVSDHRVKDTGGMKNDKEEGTDRIGGHIKDGAYKYYDINPEDFAGERWSPELSKAFYANIDGYIQKHKDYIANLKPLPEFKKKTVTVKIPRKNKEGGV